MKDVADTRILKMCIVIRKGEIKIFRKPKREGVLIFVMKHQTISYLLTGPRGKFTL